MNDIELIKAEIERLKKCNHRMADNAINSNMRNFYDGEEDCCKQLLAFIDSLPKLTCKSCGFYENNCPFIRGKFIPYPNNICKDYTYSVLKDERPRYYGD